MTRQYIQRDGRALDLPDEIVAVIKAATVAHIGFVDAGEPYVVPVNFGWEPGKDDVPDRFWFHSSRTGRKAGLIARQPRVCVQLESHLQLVEDAENACAWTQTYRSVMAWGRARPAADREEARHGLDVLMRHHAGHGGWTYPDATIDRALVWCVEAVHLTARMHDSGAASRP